MNKDRAERERERKRGKGRLERERYRGKERRRKINKSNTFAVTSLYSRHIKGYADV